MKKLIELTPETKQKLLIQAVTLEMSLKKYIEKILKDLSNEPGKKI